jgi:hypothetical protein
MAKTKSTEKAIEKVVNFCKEELKYDVEFITTKGAENQCDPEPKLITIVKKGKPHHILWTLLHEAGHAKIFGLSTFEVYPVVYPVNELNTTGSPLVITNIVTNNIISLTGSGFTSGTGTLFGPVTLYYR